MATQQEAQEALFESIKSLAEGAKAWNDPRGAKMIRDIAIAFRATAGGPQVGGVISDGE